MAQKNASASLSTDTGFVGRIATCNTSYDILRLVREFAKAYGFDYFSIGRLPGPDERKVSSVSIIANWPPELTAKYDEMGYLEKSPVIRAMRKSTKPVIWSDERANAGGENSLSDDYYALFNRFGIRESIAFPVHHASGQRGVVNVSGDRDRPSEAELMEMSYFANLIYERLVEIGKAEKTQEQTLSARERECLQWTAGGKTSQEIAIILGLSEHTVNHYLSAACQKLGAANRAHAVAKAMRSGFLE